VVVTVLEAFSGGFAQEGRGGAEQLRPGLGQDRGNNMRILFRLGNENHGVGRADFQWNPHGTLIATAGVNVRHMHMN